MGSLENHILIAMPQLKDPYFFQSVVLICEHSKDGALGIIVNRPFKEPDLEGLFFKFYEESDDFLNIVPTVFFGGPVMIERGIVLHSTDYKTKGTITACQDFYLTSHKTILQEINDDRGPKHYKLTLGHAGWSSKQLEREIENGDWLLSPTTPDFIFNTKPEVMWKKASLDLGVDMNLISGLGGQA